MALPYFARYRFEVFIFDWQKGLLLIFVLFCSVCCGGYYAGIESELVHVISVIIKFVLSVKKIKYSKSSLIEPIPTMA